MPTEALSVDCSSTMYYTLAKIHVQKYGDGIENFSTKHTFYYVL